MESQKSYPFFIGGDQMKRAENKLRDVRVLKRLTQMEPSVGNGHQPHKNLVDREWLCHPQVDGEDQTG